MYEIIEKNQYGVLVRNTTKHHSCKLCKYKFGESCYVTNCGKGYFLTDPEVEKLEDSQKELIDLRVELRVEKEKSKALEEYSRGLELKVKEFEQFKTIIIPLTEEEKKTIKEIGKL